MGTRAIYTFEDEWGQHFVYKHWDNDPKSAAEFIRNALNISWELPRFETDEFAACFIAANKKEAGDIGVLPQDPIHIAFTGKYNFKNSNGEIDMEAMVNALEKHLKQHFWKVA